MPGKITLKCSWFFTTRKYSTCSYVQSGKTKDAKIILAFLYYILLLQIKQWCRKSLILRCNFSKCRTIQPKLGKIDSVKSAISSLVIQYRSDTKSDVRRTVRKYTWTTAAAVWVVAMACRANTPSCDHTPGQHTVLRPPIQRRPLPTKHQFFQPSAGVAITPYNCSTKHAV